ncbi:MAG: hypothetical protein JW703_03765 [Candidatus Diapherotrites archaeon]|nr:hypothetical protein [Candidatus Diapherotrites archaeon]
MNSKFNNFQIISDVSLLSDKIIDEMFFDFNSIFPRWERDALRNHLALHPKQFCGVFFNGKIVAFTSYNSREDGEKADCELREFAGLWNWNFFKESKEKLSPGLFLLKHLSKNHNSFSGDFTGSVKATFRLLKRAGLVVNKSGSIDKFEILPGFYSKIDGLESKLNDLKPIKKTTVISGIRKKSESRKSKKDLFPTIKRRFIRK